MTQILKILGLLSGLLPLILTLIEQFETPGWGAEKKQAVLNVIGAIYDQLEITMITKERLLSIAGTIIDIVVAFFNLVGIFKHENPT